MKSIFESLLNDPFLKNMLDLDLYRANEEEEKEEEPKESSYTMVERKEYKDGELVNSYKRTRKVVDGKVVEDTLEREPKLESKSTPKLESCNGAKSEEKCKCDKGNEPKQYCKKEDIEVKADCSKMKNKHDFFDKNSDRIIAMEKRMLELEKKQKANLERELEREEKKEKIISLLRELL